ncbi:SDR family oxidoreductase (plasmid) [Embleya sp. NBC_00888]|uniref:SDR family NAD(P)-dependent oxidoreductase n=1 Tax=Embleya sp. NBC_00888 TaxID=2975960 RepID=UPI002F91A8DB|nr:SDR family oxidoreductase [Embleya sp. NBC_00888]
MAVEIDLAGRAALVTGAGAGIGRAVAVMLASAGADVAVVDIDADGAAETAGLVRATGRGAIALVGDMTVPDDVERTVRAAAGELGGLRIAVNNVGMMAGHPAVPFLDWTPRAMRDVVAGNLLATAYSCQAQARVLGRGGVIVNVSSGETTRPAPLTALYAAAKAAVNHLTGTLAIELAPLGIRVNAVAPGTTLTRDVEAALTPEYRRALETSIPLGGLSDPQDMARLVLLLVSDFAAHTTGQFVLSDKGAFLSRNRPELTVD